LQNPPLDAPAFTHHASTRGGYTAAAHLAIYGIAIILPLLIAFGLLLYYTVQSERAQLHARMAQTLDNLNNDINRDLARSITLLHTLASSPLLRQQDWPAFHRQSIRALPGTSYYIVLIDPSGHQIVNSYVPYGKAPALTGDPETLRQVIATRQPVVSNLFTSLVVKAPVYNVSVPVLQDGEVRYVLSLGCLPSEIERILKDQNMPPEWVTMVWDRNGAIVARSRDMEAFAGTQVPESLRAPSQPGPRVRNADGEEVLRTSLVSEDSGWGVAVSVSADAAEQSLSTLLYYWLGITAIAAAATLYLAFVFGRRLTGPLSAVASATAALARGDKVQIRNSGLREVDGLAHILGGVQAELLQQKRGVTLLINELNHRVKNTIATVQAIAAQTFRSGAISADAIGVFQARLVALAGAHDLLTRENWEGADLHDVVGQSIAPYASPHSARIEVTGPSVRLTPKAALALAMALNELCTNAAKYGVLSNDAGVLSIVWTVADQGTSRTATLEWRERGGPSVEKPQHRGFGTMLIERMLASDLDGSVQLSFDPDGVTCRIVFPL
jgi:two-component sensor histidine kinase